MKTILIIFALLVSSMSWAGPDIPWPSDKNKTSDPDEDTKDSQVIGYYTSATHEDHYYAVIVEKNDSGYFSAQCPYVLVVREIDAYTGEVLDVQETLQCREHGHYLTAYL